MNTSYETAEGPTRHPKPLPGRWPGQVGGCSASSGAAGEAAPGPARNMGETNRGAGWEDLLLADLACGPATGVDVDSHGDLGDLGQVRVRSDRLLVRAAAPAVAKKDN
jgi:hypothetical protein